jgi:hypothetical protein
MFNGNGGASQGVGIANTPLRQPPPPPKHHKTKHLAVERVGQHQSDPVGVELQRRDERRDGVARFPLRADHRVELGPVHACFVSVVLVGVSFVS